MQKKGFTIIELIVVIAIIAVLAAIVLVNVTTYINKGKDAAAIGNMATMITNSTMYFEKNGNYANWGGGATGCMAGSRDFVNPCNALINAGYFVSSQCDTGGGCSGTPTKWCVQITSKDNSLKKYCFDTTGSKYFSTTAKCQVISDTTPGTCQP